MMGNDAPLGGGAPREWDAVTYDALPLPHQQWGHGVLNTLELRGDERVLDLGAGTGRDTAVLLQRLPRGHVVAVDGSAAMLTQLRSRLRGTGAERLTIVQADLSAPLVLAEPVDAIVSVATLHWLPDHQRLFRNLLDVLRPGGVLRAEWGGAGNAANLDVVLGEWGLPRLSEIAHYVSADQTARRLRAAGFVDVRVEAVAGVARMRPGAEWEAFLRAVVLAPVLDRLPPERHDPVITDVAARLGDEGVRYVRLQAAARRPDREPDGPGAPAGTTP